MLSRGVVSDRATWWAPRERTTALPLCTSRFGSTASTRTQCRGCDAPARPQTRCDCRLPILTAVRRGILGGTFDPPHFGHLFMGEVAHWQLDLDVVTFMPAGAPWQKNDQHVSEPRHRLEMTRLAIAGVPYFEADAREVERDGWTYTADTLRTYPQHEELVVILGADAASRLPTWERHEEVVKRSAIAVMPRPGFTQQAVSDSIGAASFAWLDGPELDVSGTVIRQRISGGKPIRFLLPDAVRAYIETAGLHRGSPG